MQFSSEQVFLGYSPIHKGFLCLAPNGKTYISRHVQFEEHLFPFQLNPTFLSSTTASHSISPNCTVVPAMPIVSCSNRFSPLAHYDSSSPTVPAIDEHDLQVQAAPHDTAPSVHAPPSSTCYSSSSGYKSVLNANLRQGWYIQA